MNAGNLKTFQLDHIRQRIANFKERSILLEGDTRLSSKKFLAKQNSPANNPPSSVSELLPNSFVAQGSQLASPSSLTSLSASSSLQAEYLQI